MLFKLTKTASAIIFSLMILLPFSFNGSSTGNIFLQDSHALSSKSQPLTSNIFVEIAKKQNPAVVNVSIKSSITGGTGMTIRPRIASTAPALNRLLLAKIRSRSMALSCDNFVLLRPYQAFLSRYT